MNYLPVRKPNRLNGYDYSRNGAYFITICAKNRECLFGNIPVGAAFCRPHYSDIGVIVSNEINALSHTYQCVNIDCYVIMPNHIHMIICVNYLDDERQNAAPTVSRMINQWKRAISIKIGYSVWQKSFHDHIIREQLSRGQL